MDKHSEDIILHVPAKRELADRVDVWRSTMEIIPSRAAALRYLLELGLKVVLKKPKGQN
jgi:hypothetical protein